MRERIGFQILFIAFATALSGELRVAPFVWEFRFGLGSSTFFLLLLLMKQVPFIRTGIITGMVVVIFRTLTGPVFLTQPAYIIDIFMTHLPAMFYYCAFAFGMNLIKERQVQSNLFYLAAFGVLIDVGSNIVELSIRSLIIDVTPISAMDWFSLVIIAVVRVFFVVGLYATVILNQMNALHKEQEKRLEQMLNVGSNLYSESFYLSKMMDMIERVTASSYDLYRQLKENNLSAYSKQSLSIAEKIHEVKKDAQRVMAGLAKLYDQESITQMQLTEILNFVVRGNEQYSNWLGKDIKIFKEQTVNYSTIQYLPLLTVLNNLVANAVEAIEGQGWIRIEVWEEKGYTYFVVKDTGEGIKERDLPYIFEAGYTSKFSEKGIASTGIGLSHVKDIVEILDGSIDVESDTEGTKVSMSYITDKLKSGE
ncbi:sensor histidine kinase [Siminovitchia terrae]|uniref:Sensor histidine kinase n=1 Tax=Siminovitchia terrae TaxID=1914933 RepID=A0ABQ4KYS3_SIMTE|nr:ATP-binding protein [Siminovitchia terrae]GIN92422.1 sensor histidine kinase [Siminovitchia terrae]GIN97187.1 sensor histidine kinase [Siminovitchia terrae]